MQHLQQKAYIVKDVSGEKRGYDVWAAKNTEERHIEVKGTRDEYPAFRYLIPFPS
jgi:hypothetical protein